MSAMDQEKPPHPPPAHGEDDIIELTEVVAEAPTEVVLDFRAGSDDLGPLKSPAPAPAPAPAPVPEETRESPLTVQGEESLEDILASLPDLPADLDIPTEAPPLEIQAGEHLRRELAQRLAEAELKELVREMIQETVERLVRELLPEMAAQALERQINLLKKRLTETD